MTYARRLKYQGIEPLRDNALRILARDIPAELALQASELSITALPDFAEYLTAEKHDPSFPCIIVQPDSDDAVEDSDGAALNETNVLDVLILTRASDDLPALTNEAMQYKRAVFNVLKAAARDDLFQGITNRSKCLVQLRGGRYAWFKVAEKTYARAVKGLKLATNYNEETNR